MKDEDVYAGKPDMPDDLREFARNLIPPGMQHMLQRALILSAAKEIDRLRAALSLADGAQLDAATREIVRHALDPLGQARSKTKEPQT